MRPRSLLPFVLALPLCTASRAQDDGDDLLEGHSGHGAAFDDGPRQAAYLMDDPGSVRFPVTSEHPGVQRFFDQGVGQLHGFWYFEAERTFRQVAALDPDCAMAYWGMAMANVDNADRAADFARVAWLKRGLVTPRERLYIDAIARFHEVDGAEEPERLVELREARAKAEAEEEEDGDDEGEAKREKKKTEKETEKLEKEEEAERKKLEERAKRLVRDYEEILWEHPDDVEAKAFLVNRLWLNEKFAPPSSRHANDALLAQIFAAQPMHPAHHYRIHLWDDEDSAARVVDSAVKCGPSWPGIAHMWHMGGHIFDKLGRHADAAWQQEASARVDHAYMIRDRVLPDQIHNYAHNNEWLTRSLRHCGRVREAVDLAKNMIELPRHPRYNTLDERRCSASYGRLRLLETLELYEQWDELIALSKTMYLEPSDESSDRAKRAYLLGKAHAYLGDDAGLQAEVEALERLLAEAKTERVADLETAEEESLEAGDDSSEVREAMEAVLADHQRPLDEMRDDLEALAALRAVLDDEDVEDGVKTLRKNGFERAHLARLCLDAGLSDEAVEYAREATEKKDGQIYFHANLAYVLHATGETDEALEVFDELRRWSARADLDMPVFQRLAPLAEARGLPADWRVEERVADDVGERVDLATLGPLRWTPPRALPWTCPDGFGDEVSLADYRGRPVLVIFFLGFGCVHCVEQLQAFAPVTGQFAEAGIDIVAIGTDTVEELRRSQEEDTEETGYPFPVLADPELDLFRLYRAYDDFEDAPLHGTFLIDAGGRVRWQDVSYEPFTDHEFLLEESRRLLGLPAPGDAPAVPVSSSAAASAGGASEGSR